VTCCAVLQVDWLTPVEVFAPWYGRALAHYMLELRKHDSNIDSSTPLNIVEIGGGTGTLAASVLVSSGSRVETQLQPVYCCCCIQHCDCQDGAACPACTVLTHGPMISTPAWVAAACKGKADYGLCFV
jgi:hypothetical protein